MYIYTQTHTTMPRGTYSPITRDKEKSGLVISVFQLKGLGSQIRFLYKSEYGH